MARPTIPIDKKIFETYAQNLPTLKEMADCFKVSIDTIRRFAKREYGKDAVQVIQEFGAPTVLKLKNKLVEKALKGDNACLFFALKNFSDMSDNPKGENNASAEQLETFNRNMKLLQFNVNNPPEQRRIEDFEEDESNSSV